MVPKRIHHIVGPMIIPFLQLCIHSWDVLKQYGFEFEKWDDATIEAFLEQHHKFALDAFLNARNHAEAADIARYLIVHTYGGYYIDWDIQLLDPEKFVELSSKFPQGYMLIDPHNNTLASEYFCAKEKDVYLLNLTSDIVNLYDKGMRDNMGTPQYSGPYRMRESLKKHPDANMSTIPVKEVFAYDYREIRNRLQKTITQPMIHYWVHSWIR